MCNHTCMCLFKIINLINLLSDWSQTLSGYFCCCRCLFLRQMCTLKIPLPLVQQAQFQYWIFPTMPSVLLLQIQTNSGLLGKKSVLFSASLSLRRRPANLSKPLRYALKFRFLLSKKFVVGKTPEEGLYSCFYGMIKSNSQNFLSWMLKGLIEHKTVNKVWRNS